MPQLAWIISYHGLRWSRDGRYIFVRGTDRKGREGLYKVNAQTGETDPVVYAETGGGVQEAPVCSPNGDTLYYVRWEDQAGVRIMARNLSAGSEREVFRKPGAAISPFAMSPDGTRLAFVDNEHPRSEHKVLMVIPSEGSEPRVLVRAPKIAGFIGLIWTPDGEQLLFPKRGEDKTELWRVSVESGEPEFVNAVPASVRGLRISPDGVSSPTRPVM